MKVWGLFHGGANYSCGSVHNDRDVEEFAGISSVVDTLWIRVTGRDDAHRLADDTAEFHVWMTDPRAAANDGMAVEYPDRRVFVGPRGGIRVERV